MLLHYKDQEVDIPYRNNACCTKQIADYLMFQQIVYVHVRAYIYIYIYGVTGVKDQTSGECSLCLTIPKKPKTPISKVERLRR
jgi:hypothetical protein